MSEPAGALGVFSLLLSHCLALQVVKDCSTLLAITPHRLAATLPLAASIVWSHAAPASAASLIAMAASGLLVLVTHGSQSNHVVLEILVVGAALLTAPWGSLREAGALNVWTERLAASMRALVVVLYAVSAFAKLNDDFFDVGSSCAVLMAAAAAGDAGPGGTVP